MTCCLPYGGRVVCKDSEGYSDDDGSIKWITRQQSYTTTSGFGEPPCSLGYRGGQTSWSVDHHISFRQCEMYTTIEWKVNAQGFWKVGLHHKFEFDA